jgi:hypothetical protein
MEGEEEEEEEEEESKSGSREGGKEAQVTQTTQPMQLPTLGRSPGWGRDCALGKTWKLGLDCCLLAENVGQCRRASLNDKDVV